MPLIVMCGIPSSGKSTRAKLIHDFIKTEQPDRDVVIINEEFLGLSKNDYLRDPTQEKILRSSLKSAVEKNIDIQRVVILDSLNYIKGYRYELYCLARNATTQLCNVYCDTDIELCRERNAKGYENQHPEDLFDDYCQRMEVPKSNQRWDKPLFVVQDGQDTPYQEILNAVDSGKSKPKDPVSTQPEAVYSEDFLFKLDQTCSQVIGYIQQTGQNVGETIGVPECKAQYKVVKQLSPLQFKAAKREFLTLARVKPPRTDSFAQSFVEFLNSRNQEE